MNAPNTGPKAYNKTEPADTHTRARASHRHTAPQRQRHTDSKATLTQRGIGSHRQQKHAHIGTEHRANNTRAQYLYCERSVLQRQPEWGHEVLALLHGRVRSPVREQLRTTIWVEEEGGGGWVSIPFTSPHAADFPAFVAPKVSKGS